MGSATEPVGLRGAAGPAPSQAERRARLFAAPKRDRSLPFVLIGCGVPLALGYSVREDLWLRPSEGVGYALGIVGLTCMIALLGYSVRKRATFMQGKAPIRWWFQTHMALGLIGPSAILLHSNFSLGSPNARVALASMALVVASGVVGRVIYARVHRGLFGRKRQFDPLLREAREGFGAVAAMTAHIPELEAELLEFERHATEPPASAAAGLMRFLTIGIRRGRLASRAVRALRRAAPPNRAILEGELVEWFDRAAEVARFRGYERLLSVWHGVHLPLCVLLFGAAALHVVAVHMY